MKTKISKKEAVEILQRYIAQGKKEIAACKTTNELGLSAQRYFDSARNFEKMISPHCSLGQEAKAVSMTLWRYDLPAAELDEWIFELIDVVDKK